MRIKSIELSWFRGAASTVTLEPNGKSMVVYGENGSGKSSFVDAVEYVLNNGRIEHLRNEYSGPRQENAIPNTHRPVDATTSLRFKFQDGSQLNVDFDPNGSSKKSGAEAIAMGDWEYRQTVLRQDEVARFIYDRKGEKYSALLPLFGLQSLEMAATNAHKLSGVVEKEAKLAEKKGRLHEVSTQRQSTFPGYNDEQVLEVINRLYTQYCNGDYADFDPVSLCNEIRLAIDKRVSEFSADNQRHVTLREVSQLNLAEVLERVNKASVELTASIDLNIAEKLAVLRAARTFAESIGDAAEIACPACGQAVASDRFIEHVTTESKRLNEAEEAFSKYKAEVNSVCNCLQELKVSIRKPELQVWADGFDDQALFNGLAYLGDVNPDALRETCTADDLNAIENMLLPIIGAAARDSADAAPDVQNLTDDKNLLGVAESIMSSRNLQKEIAACEELILAINSLENAVRDQIRQRSQAIIDTISQDVQSMWSTLHPGERIDSVGLSLPEDTDKAVEVVLKFYGVDQDSPSLTLSEGFRNSLGLCIFLAMAKQVLDKERPLFLDDVVVSLDRHHRGMIQGLLDAEFNDRQIIVLTHDREWYAELRQQLSGNNGWIFKTLLPYEAPEIGIRWSSRDTTFGDARARIEERPDSAGSDARKIMDQELPLIAEALKSQMSFLRSERNDRRTAHEFLERLIADGKRCFEKKSAGKYFPNTDAITALETADQLLVSWGNKASHSFDVVRPEAIKLIDACEAALATFRCSSCDPSSAVWRLDDENSEWLQCRCGELRWRYGKA